jgi:hypothetical protein
MKNRSNFPPGFEDDEKNLSVDFDGVIHDCSKGYYDGSCYGEPMPGAIESVKGLAEKYRIVVFTAKAKKSRPLVDGKTGTELVADWLKKYGIFDCVAEITAEKPRAVLYIDDNAYRFEGWTDTLNFIKNEICE